MRQYKRPSKAQVTALALGALTIGSFGAGDAYADNTRELEWRNQSEYTRPIGETETARRHNANTKQD